MQIGKIINYAQSAIDFKYRIWYDNYIGVIIRITSDFSHFAVFRRPFVNFTMETF